MEKRVPENPVHQDGGSVTDPDQGAGTGTSFHPGKRSGIGRWFAGQICSVLGPESAEQALLRAMGITNQELIRGGSGFSYPHLEIVAASIQDLAQGQGFSLPK